LKNATEAIPLNSLTIGDRATILAIDADEAFRQRLSALGFRLGNQVELIRQAHFSGPLQIRIGTTDMMLRLQEAAKIKVQKI
jgi:ferrous iron transport protein A